MQNPHRPRQVGAFVTTHWGLVLKAADSADPEGFSALSELCRVYWYPLYAFLRRSGYSDSSAEDLTQGFFEHLLSKNVLATVRREKGRFRTFLLTTLKNFVANGHLRAKAVKRGGGAAFVSWDELNAEKRYNVEPADRLSADELFQRRWALTVIEQALGSLRKEFGQGKRDQLFDDLKRSLMGENAASYSAIAERHGMSESAVKVAAYRLRQKFRDALIETVSATLTAEEDIFDEIRILIAALEQTS